MMRPRTVHSIRWMIIALGLFVTSCVAITPQVKQGSYLTIITEEDIPEGFPAEAVPVLVGEWTTTFAGGGHTQITKDGEVVVEGTYSSTGNEITFIEESGPLSCDPDENPATYSYVSDGKSLTLTAVDDPCPGRNLVLTAHALSKQ